MRAALAAIAQRRSAQAVIQTHRAARVLSPRLRFVRGQVAAATVPCRYDVGGMAVHLRHRTRDIAILNEIFSRGAYAPPGEVAEHLDGARGLDVLDLGGNIGLFGLYAIQSWDVRRIVSYEPDSANLALLADTITVNGLSDRWQARGAAVSNQDGVMRFEPGLFSESRQALDGAGIEVPMVDVFDHDPVDLLKLDIEGGEWPILVDPRLRGFASLVVMEWHARGCPRPDAHGTARDLLEAAGYRIVRDEPGPENGLMWATVDQVTS